MPPDSTPPQLIEVCDSIAQSLAAIQLSDGMETAALGEAARLLDQAVQRALKEVLPAARMMKASGGADSEEARDKAAQLYRQFAMLNSWLEGREGMTRAWLETAATLAATEALREVVGNELIQLEDSDRFGDIIALVRQGKAKEARRILLRRREESADPKERERIEAFLIEPRNFVTPVKTMPTLGTLNGVGFGFYGRRAPDPDGTFIATYCFCVLFIPLVPIGAYLVRNSGDEWQVLGKSSLSSFALWWRRLTLYFPILLLAAFLGYVAYDSSDSVQETRRLEEISRFVEAGNSAVAVEQAVDLARQTSDPDRQEEAKQLALRALPGVFDTLETPVQAARFAEVLGVQLDRISEWKWCATPPVPERIEAAVRRVSKQPESGVAVTKLLPWAERNAGGDDPVRWTRLGAEVSAWCDEPVLLAYLLAAFDSHELPVPGKVLTRFRAHLLKDRYPEWPEHALLYINKAGAEEGREILHLRAEAAWKGEAPGDDLVNLKNAPRPLLDLLKLDAEEDLEKRAAGLEALAIGEGLEEPQATWHRLGVARRLTEVYDRLNDADPGKFPIAKARTWAEKALKLNAGNFELRARAMRFLLIEGNTDRVIELGEAGRTDSRVATWLGVGYGRAGRQEDAEKTLRPVVERELGPYLTLFGQWQQRRESLTNAFYGQLERGTANSAFIARLNRLPDAQAQMEASRWVETQIAQDSRMSQLDAQMREKQGVHVAVRELAITMLMLGRQLPNGDAVRDEKLKEAERLFLELQKLGEDDPDQQLMLGQVYFWLGKNAEGQEIFDRLEEQNDGEVLYELGSVYRDFYRSEDARRLLEKAYERLPADARAKAASLRAITSTSRDDELEWLNKADTSDPYIRSQLSRARGEQHLEAGRYAEAVEPLKKAIEYWDSQKQTVTSLNNSALLYQSLARATGDMSHLAEVRRRMGRASEMEDADSIFLSNYVDLLNRTGYAVLSEGALRPDLLHELPNRSWLNYVRPMPTVDEWAERFRAQPELRRAAELSARVVILAPSLVDGYDVQQDYFLASSDREKLVKLREALEAEPPRPPEAAASEEDEEPDPKEDEKEEVRRLNQLEERLLKHAGRLKTIRAADHPPTLAYALLLQAYTTLDAADSGFGEATREKAEAQAEESLKAFPADPARFFLATIAGTRAEEALAAEDEEFAAWTEAYGGQSVLMLSIYSFRNPEAGAKIKAAFPAGRIAELILPVVKDTWPYHGLYPWLWLRLVGHEKAEDVRRAMVKDGLALENSRINLALWPDSDEVVVEAWLKAKAFGDDAFLEKVEAHARSRGILKPVFGE